MKTFIGLLSCALTITQLTAQEPFMKSVLRITAQIEGIGEETGAGIVVGREGTKYYTVTARHVVAEGAAITVQIHGSVAKFKATLVAQDESMDAAVLAFTMEKPFVLKELIPADPDIIAQGKKVQSIGHPGGSYWIPNLINIIQQASLYEDGRFFSITPQAIVGGCSGGPVFLESGAWLGMVTETSMVQAKCLKAETISNWLVASKIPSNFIYAPAPQMVQFKAGQSRVNPDSFFVRGYVFDFSKIKPFSLGKYEVTLREFEAFVIATGYITSAEKKGESIVIVEEPNESRHLQYTKGIHWRHDEFGRLRPREQYDYPVIYVSWDDADAYCRWLSKRTGRQYRLPFDGEWGYAFLPQKNTPPGATTKFGNVMDATWNEQIGINMMPNVLITKYEDGFTRLAPPGSFPPNTWGVHDLYGNVSEWLQDKFEREDYYGNTITEYSFSGPNWLFWYRDDKTLTVEGGYVYVFKEGENQGKEYAVDSILLPEESNCFVGFRVASD